MNTFDINNIKKIIKSRKPITYSNKGDYDVSELEKLSTEDLKKIIETFEKNKLNSIINRIKEIVDDLFKNAEPDANTIMLSECRGDLDGGRELYEIYDHDCMMDIDFNEYNRWCKTIDVTKLSSDKCELLNELDSLVFDDLHMSCAQDFFDDNSSVNEYWHGCIAITNDYKLIHFICRYDCMMLNDNENNPDIIKYL